MEWDIIISTSHDPDVYKISRNVFYQTLEQINKKNIV